MKIFLYIISLCAISVFAVLLFLYFEYRTGASANYESESAAKLELVGGKYKVKLPEEEKEILKSFLRAIAKKVYYEATIHNPPGDMVPDNIDDSVIKEFKDRIE